MVRFFSDCAVSQEGKKNTSVSLFWKLYIFTASSRSLFFCPQRLLKIFIESPAQSVVNGNSCLSCALFRSWRPVISFLPEYVGVGASFSEKSPAYGLARGRPQKRLRRRARVGGRRARAGGRRARAGGRRARAGGRRARDDGWWWCVHRTQSVSVSVLLERALTTYTGNLLRHELFHLAENHETL